jgi:hypothetical protein
MLERLDTPGFLSRDLVATNPIFAFTIYDEMTQSLHTGAHKSFEQVLAWQEFFFRLAAVAGIFLLARALRVGPVASVLISAAVNAVTHLATPEAFVTNPEATPAAFAVALVLLAAGLLVSGAPLAAGLAGGLALLYDPVSAAAFWLVLMAAWLADRTVRRFLRPAWLSLVIFSLILGNLVQLQAGLGGDQEMTAPMSNAMVQLTQYRTPWVWVTGWIPHGILSYLFLLVAGVWALTRIQKHADRMTKWLTLGLAVSGVVSVAAQAALLAERAQFGVAATPARNLAFTVALPVLLCASAGWHAIRHNRRAESFAWLVLVAAALLNGQVLDLLHLKLDVAHTQRQPEAIRSLAEWAAHETWGSSLFQFPDAGKANDPGVFRALSKRSLWADWRSGEIADHSDRAGQEWWLRWQNNMDEPYSTERLRGMLRLPIDYYVLGRAHQLAGVKAVYENSEYVVYDAQDLRESGF